MVTVLIDVSQVRHSQAEHGVLGSVYSNGRDFVPHSLVVDVDVNGSPDLALFLKILRCSHHQILPPDKRKHGLIYGGVQDGDNGRTPRVSHLSPFRSSTARA